MMKENLQKIFGNKPKVMIMDFLMNNWKDSFNLVELSKKTGVSYSTIKIIMPELFASNVVIIKKRIGKSNLYSINTSDKIIKRLID